MQLWQPPIPDRYHTRSDDELGELIRARKAEMGSGLVILGHHYQADEVIAFADFTGDSFKLSQLAAKRVKEVGAKYVIFCGVHFMAETADVLTDDHVKVMLPDLGAGCSMADMADYEQTVDAWAQIQSVFSESVVSNNPKSEIRNPKFRLVPICYMNSTAAIKAFCGEHGGAVCTSSNADAIIDWALRGGATPLDDGQQAKILFIPDQHLGRNTGAAMGYDPATQMCVWDPKQDLGGNDPQQIIDSTFILWKGHCSVHKLFRPEHVDEIRALWPDVHVIVHPECAYEVCQKADSTGSTERIIQALDAAAPGSKWAIGTEVHLVNRLCNAAAKRGVTARILSDCQCLCTTMYRIDLPHLAWTLDNLAEGKPINVIAVHPEAQRLAKLALDRMLDITAASASHGPRPAEAGRAEVPVD